MLKAIHASLSIALLGCGLTGCAMAPMQTATGYASEGASATYHAAATGAHAVYTTGGDVYSGVGTAAKQPFRDLNMMQDPIPPVLVRAESKPYDVEGLDSCDAILNRVAQLDLALGPDLDSPKDHGRSRTSRTASMAAVAALDAASSAAEGFLPMRSVIKQVSGAARYDNHVKHAVLAGTVRRAFLKAVGMQHNCGWPASPLGFQPVIVAIRTTPLAVPPVAAQPQMYASARTSSAATRASSIPSASRRGSSRRRANAIAVATLTSAPPAAISQLSMTSSAMDVAAPTPSRVARIDVPIVSAASSVGQHGVRFSPSEPVATAAPAASNPPVATRAAFAASTPAYSAALSPSASFAAPWTGSPDH